MRRGWSRDRSRRVLFGEPPWGYRVSVDRTSLVDDWREQAITAVVRHMKRRGFTLEKIVVELEYLGARGRRGRSIGLTRVFELLHSPSKRPHRARKAR